LSSVVAAQADQTMEAEEVAVVPSFLRLPYFFLRERKLLPLVLAELMQRAMGQFQERLDLLLLVAVAEVRQMAL
jgi:hypothetical protein